MGRKNKGDSKSGETLLLKDGTVGLIYATVFFASAVILILASLGKAGAGNNIYIIFRNLFGIGYFLIPAIFVMLSISFARSFKGRASKVQILSSVVFFVSSLALVDISFGGDGGIVGSLLSSPLIKLLDLYATLVVLITLLAVSVLAIFDLTFDFSSLTSLFRRRGTEETSGEPLKIAGISPAEANDEVRVAAPETKLILKADLKKQLGNSDFGELKLNSKSYSSKPFIPPPLSILEKDRGKPGVGDIKANSNIIKRTLQNFGIIVEMDEVSIGPSVTRYTLKPAEGVKLSKILGLQNNLELALAAHPVRIEAPIPGKSLVGIEIPNSTKTTLGLASLFSEPEYRESAKPLIVTLGKSISGMAHFANIAKMPHILIAGATGSGKSVTIHVLVNSLLFRNPPENIKFIMIDPKRVELTLYNKIPHLLTPVITDAKKAIMVLKWAAKEMDRRYDILEKNKVRDVESYHTNVLIPHLEARSKSREVGSSVESLPYIVIIIDELADIMQAYPRELEAAIVRLAQMSRAVGIHLILSTQRPSVNVITGLIKANIPTRIALQVASQVDSRTILDSAGAEKLLGAGDMLYLSGEMSKPVRLQSPFITESEVKKVAEYFAEEYKDEVSEEVDFESSKNSNAIFESAIDDEEDDLYSEAKEVVIEAQKASTSYLQRKLRIGYARAARLIDILEEKGVVGPGEGAKPREVLIKNDSAPIRTQSNDQTYNEDEN